MSEYDAAYVLLGRSAIRRKILGLIVAEPETRRHLREIARLVGTSAGTASRELQKLVAAGLVDRSVEGRQVYFQARQASVIYRSVSEIVRNTMGAREVLRRQLADLPGVESAVIFGSYAAGMTRANSDIDLLIIGSPDRDALTDRLELSGREIGRPVNEVVYSRAELDERRRRGDSFMRSLDEHRTIPVLP